MGKIPVIKLTKGKADLHIVKLQGGFNAVDRKTKAVFALTSADDLNEIIRTITEEATAKLKDALQDDGNNINSVRIQIKITGDKGIAIAMPGMLMPHETDDIEYDFEEGANVFDDGKGIETYTFDEEGKPKKEKLKHVELNDMPGKDKDKGDIGNTVEL